MNPYIMDQYPSDEPIRGTLTNLRVNKVMSNYKIKPLEWSDPQKSNDEIRYDHVIAETPFGRFLITWKGWKEHDCPTIDESPWGEFFMPCADVEDAKETAEKEYTRRVALCLELTDAK